MTTTSLQEDIPLSIPTVRRFIEDQAREWRELDYLIEVLYTVSYVYRVFINNIPQGLPGFAASSFTETFSFQNAKLLAADAFSILIVNFSISLSMGEMFANKFNYRVVL